VELCAACRIGWQIAVITVMTEEIRSISNYLFFLHYYKGNIFTKHSSFHSHATSLTNTYNCNAQANKPTTLFHAEQKYEGLFENNAPKLQITLSTDNYCDSINKCYAMFQFIDRHI
jgi:hypothetical protein